MPDVVSQALMTREGKIARAKEMRSNGALFREIAAELGVAVSTVNAWFVDPDGSRLKARKQRYRGVCKTCGGPTTGSEGRKNAPSVCRGCAAETYKTWPQEAIVDAIHRFVERYGRKPCATDFNPNQARDIGHAWRSDRYYEDGDYPCTATVIAVFGSWNTAIGAAGLDVWDPGRYPGLAAPRGSHLAGEHPRSTNGAAVPSSA